MNRRSGVDSKNANPARSFCSQGLIGAYRIHGNLKVAERAAQQLLELDPENEGTYVLLSNIYSSFKK